MDDASGSDDADDASGGTARDGADRFVPRADLPRSIQRDLASRFALRRRRGMKRSVRRVLGAGRESPPGGGDAD